MTLLRNRSLGAVLVAELVSLTGSTMTYVALPWFVLSTTGSTARMAWVLAAELIPVGVLGIPSGSLIVRLGAKRTMNVCDAARAPLMALIPILHWTGHLTFPVLIAITFAVGCFLAPYYSSSRLIMPEVVGEDERLVAQGTAYSQAVQQMTQLGGPLLAGLLIAWITAPSVLIIDAATYAFSFVVIAGLVRAGKRVAPDESSRGVFAGLKFVVRDRLLGPALVTIALLQFVSIGLFASLPVLVFRRYGADAKIVGFLFGAVGAGALAGSIVASQVVRRLPLLRLAALGILAMALPLWLLVISMPWWLAIPVLAAFGGFAPFVNAPLISVVTLRAPGALRAKVITAMMTTAGVVGPLGYLAAGESLQYVSVTFVFFAVAIGFTVGAIAFAAVLRGEDATPAAAPEPAV